MLPPPSDRPTLPTCCRCLPTAPPCPRASVASPAASLNRTPTPSPSASAAAFSPHSGLQLRPSLSQRSGPLPSRAPSSSLSRAPASSLPALRPPPSPLSSRLALLGLVALLIWSGRLHHRAPSAFLLEV
ncbi:hypothetical protein ACQJBY_059221 [Aegilops geniculata]